MVTDPNDGLSQPAWGPLSAAERRVAGVLVEKAKTTPDAYPLSLNALTNGCNQKSNRSPQMNLTADDVEEVVERLLEKRVVAVVQGSGRVVKYRHYMKEWLSVDGAELAVMVELLLRGAQTVGELRGRAARMAPIPDLGALWPIMKSLQDKQLVVTLTQEGRGQVVTHGLYTAREMENLRQQYGAASPLASSSPPVDPARTYVAATPSTLPRATPADPRVSPVLTAAAEVRQEASSPALSSHPGDTDSINEIRAELSELRAEVARLRIEVEDLWTNIRG